jgi:isopentenyldiphosphate isomerase
VSAHELVALYDPDDVTGLVVGAAQRSKVRAQNLPHAATAVLVRRSDGAWFVHRRAQTKDLWPGAHDCAAGGVLLAGESPDEAARRELAEELGIEGVAPRALLTAWYRGPDTHYLAHVYEVVWDGEVAFADGEVAAGWWEPESGLRARLADPAWPFVPDTRYLLELLAGDPDPGASGRPWPPGSTAVYRSGRDGRSGSARLATVVEDGPDGLLLWGDVGWPTVTPVLADGQDIRTAPVAGRGQLPRIRRAASWHTAGTLMLVPTAGEGWSLWWSFRPDGQFIGWYGNLEAPHRFRRTERGTQLVDTADRALDVWVPAGAQPQWKDEDEFAAYTGLPGRWTVEQAQQIRAEGEHLMALARSGAPPFDGRWTTFRPDPNWPRPSFPEDWDLPHRAGP